MNKPESFMSNDDRLLAKLGGRYILHVQSLSQAISFFMGPLIGFYFIYITANLSQIQILQLLINFTIFTALANLLIFIYVRISTRQARTRLDHIFKGRPLPENNDEILAWKEMFTLPVKAALAHVVFSYLLVILPVVLFMHFWGSANWSQIMIIIIAGTLVEISALILSLLFLDARLSPTRQALLPSDPAQQTVRSGIRQSVRPYSVIIFLLIFSQLSVGVLVYQKHIAALIPGTNLDSILNQLQAQLGIIGAATFIIGILLASRLFLAASQPTQEMARTVDEIQKGNLSQRAAIMSSDETAQLTIRLNQLLDQLQVSQTGLEKHIEERTKDLARKTSYLQAAAWVAHEAAGLQDINTLLARTVELISSRFGFYHTGIFLLDDSGEHAVLQAASSEGGRRMLARGHKLEVGLQGIVGTSAYQNRPRVVTDVETDKDYYKNPDLPTTRAEAAIPLTARGKVLGVLDIQSTEPAAFQQDDIEVFQAMADQIALAIQNAQSLVESQSAIQKMEFTTAEDVQRIWRERVKNANRAYRYTSVGLTSVTEPLHASVTIDSHDKETSRLSIPIVLRGQHIGTITLHRKKETAWSETDRSLAIEVSNQVGLALENARLLDEAQRRAAQEQSLSQLTAHLSSSLDPETILQTAVRELYRLPNVEEVSVYVAPQDTTTPPKEASKK